MARVFYPPCRLVADNDRSAPLIWRLDPRTGIRFGRPAGAAWPEHYWAPKLVQFSSEPSIPASGAAASPQ